MSEVETPGSERQRSNPATAHAVRSREMRFSACERLAHSSRTQPFHYLFPRGGCHCRAIRQTREISLPQFEAPQKKWPTPFVSIGEVRSITGFLAFDTTHSTTNGHPPGGKPKPGAQQICDVSCDVTPASKPVQERAKRYYGNPFRSDYERGRFLGSCNLSSLPLIPS